MTLGTRVKPASSTPGIRQSSPLYADAEIILPMWDGAGATVQDVSPNTFTANITGAAWSAGSYGHQLTFDPAAPLNDKVEIANDAKFATVDDFTIAVLINPDLADVTSSILEVYDAVTTDGYAIRQANFGSGAFAFFSIVAGTSVFAYSDCNPVPGTWYLLVGRRTGTAVEMFIDGDLQTHDAVSTGQIASTCPFLLGINVATGGDWDGDIAFAGMWSRALSTVEIEALSKDVFKMVRKVKRRRSIEDRLIMS